LWDKFFLFCDARVSLRDAIARGMLVNTLIHREFSSSYVARFVVEKDRMFVENANRAVKSGLITLDDFEPNPKNPLIASFFRNIGLADELGSGVRNLYRYGRRYSGKDPELIDGDIFRINVPLDDAYSLEEENNKAQIKRNLKRKVEHDLKRNLKRKVEHDLKRNLKRSDRALTEKTVLAYLREHPDATQVEVANAIGKSRRAIQDAIAALKDGELLEREGARKSGGWIVRKYPELPDGDAPHVTMPPDDTYSPDEENDKAQIKRNLEQDLKRSSAHDLKRNLKRSDRALTEKTVLAHLREHPEATQVEIAKAIEIGRAAGRERVSVRV
jgi:ATP-dependent DNA helicase RecG